MAIGIFERPLTMARSLAPKQISKPGSILLPQSWAWLSGGANRDRAAQALESAWNHLVCEDEGMVLLFEPPFDQAEPSPGYIKGYPPGVRENGGQYTHAALWLAMAMARSGDGNRAAEILRLLNPIEHTRDPETVWRYGVEPYVIAADVYAMPGRIGQWWLVLVYGFRGVDVPRMVGRNSGPQSARRDHADRSYQSQDGGMASR